MEDAVKDQNLRMGQNRTCEQDPHDMRRSKNFSGGLDVGLEDLRERVDVFFQFGEAQRPPDVAVRNIGSSQDDIILDRAFEQGGLGVDHEPSTTIDRLKIVVAKDAADRHFQACQDLCERLFSRRRTGVDADLFARGDFKIEMFEDRQDSGVDDRKVFAGHSNAVNVWIRQRNGQGGGGLVPRKREQGIKLFQTG